MEIEDLETVVIPDVANTITLGAEVCQNFTSTDHLIDHDYIIYKSPRTYTKTPKKLKALHNCTGCGYRTTSQDLFQLHKCQTNLHRNNLKKPPMGYEWCSYCNINNERNLAKYTDSQNDYTNSNTVYKCPKCNFSTNKSTSLKIHMHIHTRGSPFKCSECPYSGSSLKDLIKHYDVMKDLRCVCGYYTHLKQHMSKHMRSHTDKEFRCKICDISMSDQISLHKHMHAKHVVVYSLEIKP